ncbi:MAG: hypothetical protein WBF15_19450 [Candidatus Sulfotelmatobacter sp.]
MVTNKNMYEAQELLNQLASSDKLTEELEGILTDAALKKRASSTAHKRLKDHFASMRASVRVLLDEVRSRLPEETDESEVRRLTRVLWLRGALKRSESQEDDFNFDSSEPSHNED